MDIKALIPIVIQTSLFLLIAAVGMRSKWSDLTYVLRKPRNLVRALIAVNIVVPAAAIILCSLFPLEFPTKAGLIVMAISPLAPFATGKMLKSSPDRSYDVGLYAALILAAVVIVPLTIAILNPWYEKQATISVVAIAWFVLKSVFIPLCAGIAVATIWPHFAERAAPIANLLAYLLLLPVAVLLLIKFGGAVMGLIGDGALVVITGTILVALSTGHWLGGRDPGHRSALSQAAATRHPGIAALIVHGDPNAKPEVMLAIVLFLLLSIVLTALYAVWARRQVPRADRTEPQ